LNPPLLGVFLTLFTHPTYSSVNFPTPYEPPSYSRVEGTIQAQANAFAQAKPIDASPVASGIQANAIPGDQGSVPDTAAIYKDLYVLGPGDGLVLTFNDPTAQNLGGNIIILPDGTANIALLGSVQLSGLTIAQASQWLSSLYSRVVLRPELVLSLVSPRPMNITILGEVQRPGLYSIGGLSTPYNAIQQAGGTTLNSDIRNIILRRVSSADGRQRQAILNLAEILQYGNQQQNPVLFDGDTIIVGRTEEPNPDEVLQISASTLAPESITVNILGEVNSPGGKALRANTPLDDAISAAGGARNWTSNKRNVELVRMNRNGTRTRQVFTLDQREGISNGLNPPLRNGDTIIVHRSFYGDALQFLDQLVFPLVNTVDRVRSLYDRWDNYDRNFR
jgi:polysaccharide export outer membrane protein